MAVFETTWWDLAVEVAFLRARVTGIKHRVTRANGAWTVQRVTA